MALPSSGAIAFSDVNVELGFSSTATIALNDNAVRTLFGIASGQISMSDGYGKAASLGYVDDVFSIYTYTGTAVDFDTTSTQTITNGINLSGSGGLVWIKGRNGSAADNLLFDTARGPNLELRSHETQPNIYNANTLTAFNNNGFSLRGFTYVNGNGPAPSFPSMFVSWTFRKSQKFFDIVTYTGDSVFGRAISHNLGSTPGLVIIKRTDTASTWKTYWTSIGAVLNLNSNAATPGGAGNGYCGSVSSSTFTVYSSTDTSSFSDVNLSGATYVAYLFASNAGGYGITGTDSIITCGSYTGDGTSGKDVTFGWEPQWMLLKQTNSNGNWMIMDNMRRWSMSLEDSTLFANLSSAESITDYNGNPTATGYRTGTNFFTNGSSATYVYMAIRRPMKVPTSANTVFSPVLRTGTGSSANVVVDFAPDLTVSTGLNGNYTVWIDKLRGANNVNASQLTNPESYLSTSGTQVESFHSSGITYGASGNYTNSSGTQQLNWIFRRAPKFFDIVCYTGTSAPYPATPQDVSHNLGAVPELIIIRRRSGDDNWFAYHSGTALPNAQFLNLFVAAEDNSSRMNTAPTSSTFNVRSDAMVNASGQTYVAYLFATVAGVSKVGSYTGSTGIQQIDCGFTSGARFVMIKRTDSGANGGQENGQWYCFDTARGIVTGNDPYISMNRAQANQTGMDYIDPYSAGFELSYPFNTPMGYPLNVSGATYIYLAIA